MPGSSARNMPAVDEDADLAVRPSRTAAPRCRAGPPSGAGARPGSRSPTPTPPDRLRARRATDRSRRRRAGPRPGADAGGRGCGRRSTARSSSGPRRRCRPASAGVTPRCSSAVRSLSFAIGRPPGSRTSPHTTETSRIRPRDVLGPHATYRGRLRGVRLHGDPVPPWWRNVIAMTTNRNHCPTPTTTTQPPARRPAASRPAALPLRRHRRTRTACAASAAPAPAGTARNAGRRAHADRPPSRRREPRPARRDAPGRAMTSSPTRKETSP